MSRKAWGIGHFTAKSSAIVLLGPILLLWSLSAWAQSYFPKTPEELVQAILDFSANPNRTGTIHLDGIYEFEETWNDTTSLLPPLPDGKKLIVYFAPQTVVRARSGATGSVTFYKFSGVTPIDMFFADTRRFLLPTKSHPFPHGEPLFQGIDTLIDAKNATIILDGITADCDDCIRAEDSRIIVTNSSFSCTGNCIENLIGTATTGTEPADFDDLRESLMDAGLSPSELAAVLRQVDQSEGLLNNHDVAVVDSSLSASGMAMNIGSLGGPDTRVLIDRSYLETAGTRTGVLSLKNSTPGSSLKDSVLFSSNPFTTLEKTLRVESGDLTVTNSVIQQAGQRAITLRDGSITFSNSAIAIGPDSPDSVCSFSTGNSGVPETIASDGFNIVSDDSCGLGGTGDQENTDPGLFFPTGDFMIPEDGNVLPQFLPGSPAIDGGRMAIENNQLPCSVTDINGLPRPQDGSGNGTAECDVGPVEMQQGPDIGPPQTGAFFDIDRDGEGVFVEMLGAGRALVYLFSYTPDGDPFWTIGVGDVIGNGISIRKENFFTTRGATFGPNFDPADVQLIPFADMAMSFPNCANGNEKGVLAIDSNSTLGYPPLLSRTSRLTSVLSCSNGAAMGPGFSGSFADPAHNGEGVIVQVIGPTSALVIWFTYDSDGNQDWILGVGTIDGNTITVLDAFSQTGPKYGPTFDTNDVVRTTWGDFTVTFDGGCNNAVLDYGSVIPSFGSGNQNLSRISNIEGLECDS